MTQEHHKNIYHLMLLIDYLFVFKAHFDIGILRNLEFGMSGRKNETCPFWHRGWLASQTNCKNWAQNNDIDSTKCSTVVNAPSPGISVFGWLCPSTAVYGVYCANMTHVWYNSETTVFCKEWPKKSAHSGHSVTVFFLLRFCKRHKQKRPKRWCSCL